VVLKEAPESPLDSKEFKPILREINPEYSLKGLMLKLKLNLHRDTHREKHTHTDRDTHCERGNTQHT